MLNLSVSTDNCIVKQLYITRKYVIRADKVWLVMMHLSQLFNFNDERTDKNFASVEVCILASIDNIKVALFTV